MKIYKTPIFTWLLIAFGIVTVIYHALASTSNKYTFQDEPTNNVIYKPYCDPVLNKNQQSDECFRKEPSNPRSERIPETNGVFHSIFASKQVTPEALRQYLEQKNSPLKDHVPRLLESPYWSTILAICTIEEYSCSVNPYGSNNFWGLMRNGNIIRYNSMDAGIDAIDQFLTKADNNGRTTIESLNGWYVQPASNTWFNVVVTTKQKLESL